LSGQHRCRAPSLAVLIAGAPQANISIAENAGDSRPEFSSMRKFIFSQQPPKQPLVQNKNGSRFGCLASC
jgi:hypothetical protein